MERSNVPNDEKQGFGDLEYYRTIGIEEQEEFDFLVAMTARICTTNIAVISIFTKESRYVLSSYGLDENKIFDDFTFYSHASKKINEPLIIEDTRVDKRFQDNSPTNDELAILFYASIPLVSSSGDCFGMLCAIDDKPKNLSKKQIEELTKLGKLCVSLFEKRKVILEKNQLTTDFNEKKQMHEETQSIHKLGNWELDIETKKAKWSEMVYDIYELPRNLDLDQNKIQGIDFYHTDYKDIVNKAVENCISNAQPFNIECILITHKQNQKWVRATGRKVGDKLIGSFQDITEIKEQALKFKGIFNSTFAFIGFLDLNGILLEANDTAVNMAGISHSDVIGKYFWDCYWWHISEKTQKELKINFQKALKGETLEYEVAVWVANQTPITILFSLKPILDENGKVVYVIPEGRPIQEVVDAKRKYKAVLDGTNVGTWEWNVQTGITVFNERWAEIVGYTLDELSPISIETWNKLAHPDDLEESGKRLNACFEKKQEFYEFEARIKHKNGNWVWVYDRGKVFEWTEDGKPLWMYGTHQDITERKLKEEELRISEESFRGNFQNAAVGMAIVSPVGQWLKVNKKLCEILGYSEKELLKLTFQKITHPDDLSIDQTLLHEVIDGKRSNYQMEKRYFHKEGHLVYIILAVSSVKDIDGKILYFISQIIDISKRKKQEQELRYQKNLLSSFYQLSPIGIVVSDYQTGKFVDANDKLIEPTGYSKEEFLALHYRDITPKEFENLDYSALQQLEEKGSYERYEKEYIRKDGSRYPVSLHGVVVTDVEGKKLTWSLVRNISQEKEAEQKLKEAILKLQAVLDASKQVAILATDSEGQIILFNSGAEQMLGYKAEELVKKHTPALIHLPEEIENESNALFEKYGKKITGFETFIYEAKVGNPTTKEWSYKSKDGHIIPVLLSINKIADENNITGYLGVATDISKLKKVEKEIRSLLSITEEQNDRLKNFAHIVSHNLRSHSGGISGLIELLQMEYPDLSNNELITLLKSGTENLKQTVEDLTDIVKVNLTVQELQPIRLHGFIEKNVKSLSSQISKAKIKIINEIPDTTQIQGIPAYVDSIILNMITNAIKYKSTDRASFLRIFCKVEDSTISLFFNDNGLGIDLKKHGEKIFGMYKTFHRHNDSRGVGLFITKNQVESMGGKITVESEVNIGTTFIITLKNKL